MNWNLKKISRVQFKIVKVKKKKKYFFITQNNSRILSKVNTACVVWKDPLPLNSNLCVKWRYMNKIQIFQVKRNKETKKWKYLG